MRHELRDTLLRQLDIAWQLTSYHLQGLSTDECLRRPAPHGMHVHRRADGSWQADWPDHEGYDLGPPSIAWITWHIDFWWSMTIDHCFGAGALSREVVTWRGSAEAAWARIRELHADWRSRIEGLSDDDLCSPARTRWPVQDRPFADVVAWLNLELMKNAAEIGYARFVHGASGR